MVLMVTLWKSIPLMKRELSKIACFTEQQEQLRRDIGYFDIFWSISMAKAREGYYRLLNSNTFEMSEIDILLFWQQAIINTDNSWFCTNYVDDQEHWKKGFTKSGIELQRLSIKLFRTKVRRIFIYDDVSKALLADRKEIMKTQLSYGIEVKWLTCDMFLKYAPFSQFMDLIGTFDFAIINDKYLLEFFQKTDKTFTRLQCTSEEKLVQEIIMLYSWLWDESKDINELPNL